MKARSAFVAFVACLTMIVTMARQTAQADTTANPLQALAWERRVLLLFADQPADPWAFQQRLDILEDRCDFNNRDLILLEVYADTPVRATGRWLDGRALDEAILGPHDVERIDNKALRQSYGIDAGFGLILVGKDGSEKRRSSLPVSVHEIFAQIDGMPMRQREMRDDNCASMTQDP